MEFLTSFRKQVVSLMRCLLAGVLPYPRTVVLLLGLVGSLEAVGHWDASRYRRWYFQELAGSGLPIVRVRL